MTKKGPIMMVALLITLSVVLSGCGTKSDGAGNLVKRVGTEISQKGIENIDQYFVNPTEFRQVEEELTKYLVDLGVNDQDVVELFSQIRETRINVMDVIRGKDLTEEEASTYTAYDIKGLSVVRIELKYKDMYKVLKDLTQIHYDSINMGMNTEDLSTSYSKYIRNLQGKLKTVTLDTPIIKDDKGYHIINSDEVDVNLENIIFGHAKKFIEEKKQGYEHVEKYNNSINMDKQGTGEDKTEVEWIHEGHKGTSIHDLDLDSFDYVPGEFATDKKAKTDSEYDDSMDEGYEEGMYEDPSLYISN